jgi:hypothetical protein
MQEEAEDKLPQADRAEEEPVHRELEHQERRTRAEEAEQLLPTIRQQVEPVVQVS